jgi:hypothetical protein
MPQHAQPASQISNHMAGPDDLRQGTFKQSLPSGKGEIFNMFG